MKHTKKIVGLLLTFVMILSLTTTAFAAKITIRGGAEGSKYAAYKLFAATKLNDNSGKYDFTVNDKYANALQTATGKTTNKEIAEYIEGLNADETRTFADALYMEILADEIDADYTTESIVFEGIAQGYYLIAETDVANDQDTFSLVMLDTAGEDAIIVDTKEDLPSLDKQVKEENDTTGATSWGESADHDVYDVIDYKINGTVSSKYADYKSYYYRFVDNMDESLSLYKPEDDAQATYTYSIKVYVDTTEVTSQFIIEATEHAFTATANLKELTGVTITADSEIRVEYKAVLNEEALKGEPGNKNTAYLEYENNPYHEADGDPNTPDRPEDPDNPDDPQTPGKTLPDTNIVFTYKTIVNKVDESGDALEGAEFTLFKNVAGAWVKVGETIKDVTTFEFEGLDVGKYKLEETKVPQGYNKAADIEFEVVATYDTSKDPVELTGLQVKDKNGNVISGNDLTFTADKVTGVMETDVVNRPGFTFPTTGGIGTTLFYVIGAILVLGSGVVLVTRKRMSK